MSRVEELLAAYRERLLGRDEVLSRAYARRWLGVESALEAQYLNLAMDVVDLREAGYAVGAERIYQLERYQNLLGQVRVEMERFNRFVAGEIQKEQYLAGRDGLKFGAEAIRARYLDGGGTTVGSFQVLPVEAIRTVMGLAGDGTPLFDLLQGGYGKAVTGLTQALINGVALGYNPRKTARVMKIAMAGNLQRALVISRSEQGRAMRMAQVMEYRASGVVSGYRRRCALSQRTCLACLLQDGRTYRLGEQFSDHPNGRCFGVPILYDGDPYEQQVGGRDWFLKQDAGVQEELMGRDYYRAWKDGAFDLGRLSRMHNHAIWGESPALTPLKELQDVG